MHKKIGKLSLALIFALILFLFANGVISSFSFYNPKETEAVSVYNMNGAKPLLDKKARILTFNTGYASLGEESDLYSEGGRGKRASADEILKNARGISELINLSNADALLLQSVDFDSYRSRYVDQYSYYINNGKFSSTFAYDHKARSTSFFPPYKKVNSGVLTLSKKTMASAKRVPLSRLSAPFSSNPSRCMLVTEMPIENSDKKLVLINFELDARISLEDKIKQTAEVLKYAQNAANSGDYVIAGGSFYRYFEGTDKRYPLPDRLRWDPEELTLDEIPSNLNLIYDETVATTRILSSPYDRDSEEEQVYVSDGFVISKNLSVNMVVTVDQEFRYSSHNPVLLDVTFK